MAIGLAVFLPLAPGPLWVRIFACAVGFGALTGVAYLAWRRGPSGHETPRRTTPAESINHGLAHFPADFGHADADPYVGVLTTGEYAMRHFVAGCLEDGRCWLAIAGGWTTRGQRMMEFDSPGEMKTWLRPQEPVIIRRGEYSDRAYRQYFR